MALVYDEHLVSLGIDGLLGLSLSPSYDLPLPAHRFGYAHWFKPDGSQEDRFELCTRRLHPSELRASLERLLAKYKGHGMVRGVGIDRLKWTETQVGDHYVVAPSVARTLGDGKVLLLFAAKVGSAQIRVVDVPRN